MPEDDKPKRTRHKNNALTLNEHDAKLWKYLKQSVTPLDDKNRFEPHGDLEQKFSAMVEKTGVKKKPAPSDSKSVPPVSSQMPSYTPPVSIAKPKARRGVSKSTPELADFQHRDVRKIVTGNLPIEASLDLHGMTQNKAKPALKRFLKTQQQLGCKMVLVITGKGNSKRRSFEAEHDVFYENASEGGVLQYSVPNWLDEEAFRDMVVSYRTAHRSHGEEGALYVRLRKVR